MGICPSLAHLVDETKETRYGPLVDSGCRTGSELLAVWRELQEEYREACHFLGKEVVGPAALEVGGIGEDSTTGATRKILAGPAGQGRFDCFEQCLASEGGDQGPGHLQLEGARQALHRLPPPEPWPPLQAVLARDGRGPVNPALPPLQGLHGQTGRESGSFQGQQVWGEGHRNCCSPGPGLKPKPRKGNMVFQTQPSCWT